MTASIKSKLSVNEISEVFVSEDEVCEAISSLKNKKTDSLGLFSQHLKFACPVIAHDMSEFLTACLRHSYLPKTIRDCVIVPVQVENIRHTAKTIVLLH